MARRLDRVSDDGTITPEPGRDTGPGTLPGQACSFDARIADVRGSSAPVSVDADHVRVRSADTVGASAILRHVVVRPLRSRSKSPHIEDAIRKRPPCRQPSWHGHRVLSIGMAADIVVFDADTVADRATIDRPTPHRRIRSSRNALPFMTAATACRPKHLRRAAHAVEADHHGKAPLVVRCHSRFHSR